MGEIALGVLRGAWPLRATILAVVACLALGGRPSIARAQEGAKAPFNTFACVEKAQAIMAGLNTVGIRAERDLRLKAPPQPGDPAAFVAHRLCVVAEFMRRLGDGRAAEYYQQAIIASGGEPGYELRLADYLSNARGPRAPLIEQAEWHYQAALEGVRARASAPSVEDATVAELAMRGLMLSYQQDGMPLLPWKAFPYERRITPRPSVALMVGGRIAVDTNEVPVDLGSPPAVDDARRFTSEAMFAASMFRKSSPLRQDELQAIARAPLREEVMARARVRVGPVGAVDVWYRGDRIHDGQITNFNLPKEFNDVTISEVGVGFSRALDLHPAFDLLLAADYRRVHRVGVVEFFPQQAQDFNLIEAKPVVARFFGPDKVSLGGAFVYMGIPDVVGGVIEDRARGRTIVALNVDYAIYRPLLLPQLQRGLHISCGVAKDDEIFGVRTARRRDAYFGLGLLGMGSWDLTVQGSLFAGSVEVRPLDPRQFAGEDPQQTNMQYRTTIVLLRRLLDEDAQPGLPAETLGVRPSVVNAVLTMRHDTRLSGLYAFQNVRAGLDLWAKAFVTALRGTAFLASAGYENQYFYEIHKDLHVLHLELRMGW